MEIDRVKVPPHSLEAERAVLGSCIIDDRAVSRVIELLEPDDFYLQAHRAIFQAVRVLFNQGTPCEYLTVADEARKQGQLDRSGGIAYLVELTNQTLTSANVVHYAGIVKEHSIARQLIDVGTDIIERSYAGEQDSEYLLDLVEKRVFDISQGRLKRSFSHIGQISKAAFTRLEELFQSESEITGISSGFADLDQMTSGFQKSDLIIVAARPAMGKTALVLNMAQNAAQERNGAARVAMFSLEMSEEQLFLRMLCSQAGVDATRVRTGRLSKEDWAQLALASGDLSDLPIYIDDTPGIGVLEIRAKCRRLHAELGGLDMIIVDYLQLVGGTERESREQQISEISRSLKALAKELHVPVIALSQLNRSVESRQDKRPMPSDLRESGAIEQDADVILFIYRDDYYHPDSADKNLAEIIIGKQRSGPTGTAKLYFRKELTRFENLERHRVD